MKNQNIESEAFESTYAMLVRSEEKERSASETGIYLVLILSTVFSIWHVAQQPITLPTSLAGDSFAHASASAQPSV